MMRSKLLILFGMVALIGLLAPSAQAWIITHNGTVIFSDDQESEGVGNEMVAEVGSYGYPAGNAAPVLRTGDSSGEASGGPGAAFAGDNYVRKSRLGPSDHQQEAIFAGGAVDSGIVNAKIAYWYPASDTFNSIAIVDNRIGQGEASGEAFTYIMEYPSSGADNWWGAAGGGDLGAAINFDQWVTMELILDLDNGTAEVITNGVSGGVNDVPNPGNVPISRFYWRNEGGGGDRTLYTDAFPEPGSLALLAGGGLMLLSRRRRKA